jgi:hypothetical protein
MNLRIPISKLNWRQIVIHLVAACFFMYAFYIFSYLTDTELVNIIRRTTSEERDKVLVARSKTASDLVYFVMWKSLSMSIGLLVAFAVSLGVSLRQRWLWLNSLIVFLIGFFLFRLVWLGTDIIGSLTVKLGQLLNNIHLEFIVSGGILFTIGLLLFLSPKSRQFISAATTANT